MTDEKDPKWITMTLALSENRTEFRKDVVSLMFSPIVYIVMGKDVVLYVGMSNKGLARVFDGRHHVLSKRIWDDVESVQVLKVNSVAAARTLEARLIQEFKPTLNDRQCIRVGSHVPTWRILKHLAPAAHEPPFPSPPPPSQAHNQDSTTQPSPQAQEPAEQRRG